jgi:hypothetical protein
MAIVQNGQHAVWFRINFSFIISCFGRLLDFGTFLALVSEGPRRQKGEKQVEQVKPNEGRRTNNRKVYRIFSIVEKPGNEKNIWLDIGIGWLNRDDSITCKLDCIPINGVLQLRKHDVRRSEHTPNHYLNRRSEGGYQG